MARELGPGRLESRASVSVSIADDNDNAPRFAREKYRVRVRENVRPGTVILKVKKATGQTRHMSAQRPNRFFCDLKK